MCVGGGVRGVCVCVHDCVITSSIHVYNVIPRGFVAI